MKNPGFSPQVSVGKHYSADYISEGIYPIRESLALGNMVSGKIEREGAPASKYQTLVVVGGGGESIHPATWSF